jgi:alkylated DNA repair dioxygenase AlkB
LRNKCIESTKGLFEGIEKYSAEAVIINYYKIKDTMTGHLGKKN